MTENKLLEIKIDFQDKEIQIPVKLEGIAIGNKNGENGCGCETVYQCPACEENGGCGKPLNGENINGNGTTKPDENAIYKTGEYKK